PSASIALSLRYSRTPRLFIPLSHPTPTPFPYPTLFRSLIPGRFQATPDGRHVMYVEKLSRDRQRAENIFMAEEKKSVDEKGVEQDRKSTRLNSSHQIISYAVFCLKKKKKCRERLKRRRL